MLSNVELDSDRGVTRGPELIASPVIAEQWIEPERAPYSVREGGSLLTFVRDPVNGYRVELIGARSE